MDHKTFLTDRRDSQETDVKLLDAKKLKKYKNTKRLNVCNIGVLKVLKVLNIAS